MHAFAPLHRPLAPSFSALAALPSLVALAALAPLPARAAGLVAPEPTIEDHFGTSVSISGDIALVGSPWANWGFTGEVYVFRNLDTASGTITPDNIFNIDYRTVRNWEGYDEVFPSNHANSRYGYSVSLVGEMSLVGAPGWNWGELDTFYSWRPNSGTVFFIQNFNHVSPGYTTVWYNPSGQADDYFGWSVSLSSARNYSVLIGAPWHDANGTDSGTVYYASGAYYSGIGHALYPLTASDGAAGDNLGYSVSLSGTIALAGAPYADPNGTNSGAAYLFDTNRTLSFSLLSNNEYAKLTPSDGAAGDQFGLSVSLSGNTALVGAHLADIDGKQDIGAAYLFRDIHTASGNTTESARLIASDPDGNRFGYAVSLSGDTALVTALSSFNAGAVYLFLDLDAATGRNVTETVKITASDGGGQDEYFGGSLSIDGDRFIIGAQNKGDLLEGKAYTGTVSSLTTLDAGNALRLISGISFESRTDWVIGQTTDHNTVVLFGGDTANITADGKAVYIGQHAGSDHNTLDIAGHLAAREIFIGSTGGNTGNALVFESTATLASGADIYLAAGNSLVFAGDHADGLMALLTSIGATLHAGHDALTDSWAEITGENHAAHLTALFADGYTTFAAIPEPATTAALAALATLALATRRRTRRSV